MGYIIILAIGAIALILIAASAMRGSRRTGGKTLGGHDVTPHQPASEQQPTPGASDTEPQRRIEAAQKRLDPS